MKLGLFALITCGLLADTLELKTGERMDGTFKQAGAAGVVIEVAGQPLTVPLEKVKAIYFGAASPANISAFSPIKDALDALRGLRSVTESGVSYRQYSERVLDAKVKVDQVSGDSSPAAAAATSAMRYYQLASNAWNSAISVSNANSYAIMLETGRGLQELLGDCPTLSRFVSTIPAKIQGSNRTSMLSSLVGQQPSVVWPCASAKLALAENASK